MPTGLHGLPLLPTPAEPSDSIPLAADECTSSAAAAENQARQDRLGKVGKQNRVEKCPGGVLDHGPQEVAVAEIRGRAARSARPAHVLNHGRGHVSGGMACEPEPVAEIDILSIAEEVFVESTRFDDQLPSVERGSRTG